MPDSTQWQTDRTDLGAPAAKGLWIYLASGAAVALSVLGVLALPPGDESGNPSTQALHRRSALERALGSLASADLAVAPQVSLDAGSGVASLDGVLGDAATAPPVAAPPEEAVAPPPRQTPARHVVVAPRANQPAPRQQAAPPPTARPQAAPQPAPRPQAVPQPVQPAPQPVQPTPQPMWPAPQPMWPAQQGPALSPPPGGYPYPAFGYPC